MRAIKNNTRIPSLLAALIISAGVAMGLTACGSSSNDQGVALTLLGFFAEAGDADGDLPTGLTGMTVPLGTTGASEGFATLGGAATAFVGVQNNLSGQFVQLERMFVRYAISGSGMQPPSTSLPMGTVVGPAGVAEGEEGAGASSNLPDPLQTGLGPRTFYEVFILPPDVREWLNFNRNQLPEPPFNLIATVEVQGTTSAGDTLISNPVDLIIQIIPDNLIPPQGGSGGGADGGAGDGDADTIDGGEGFAFTDDTEESNESF